MYGLIWFQRREPAFNTFGLLDRQLWIKPHFANSRFMAVFTFRAVAVSNCLFHSEPIRLKATTGVD